MDGNQQKMTAEQLASLRSVMPRANMDNMVNNGQQAAQSPQPQPQPMQQQGVQQQQQNVYMTPQDIAMRQQQAQQSQQPYGQPQPQPQMQPQMQPQQNQYQQQHQAQPQQQPQPQLVQPNQNVSATQAMRARMAASKGANSNITATQMQQGDAYNPTGQPMQADQFANVGAEEQTPDSQIAQNTIINSTDQTRPQKSGGGFKMSKKMALGIAGIVFVMIIGVIFIVTHGTPRGSADDQVVDDWNEDDFDWVGVDSYFEYDFEEVEELRSVGYTGDEIEQAELQQIPAADLIRQARAARNAYVQMTLAPMYDTASYEYKNFIEQTWLTLPERDDMYEWKNLASYYEERKNLDYEKIDVYGSQLFIKVYLDDNYHEDWFFCLVSPEDWQKLDDYGNIVVNYTYCTRFDGDDLWTAQEDFENIYIISASIEFTN